MVEIAGVTDFNSQEAYLTALPGFDAHTPDSRQVILFIDTAAQNAPDAFGIYSV